MKTDKDLNYTALLRGHFKITNCMLVAMVTDIAAFDSGLLPTQANRGK
jgi:hypothetical protein